MAARLRIIVLERDRDANGFDYVLWADVPTARQPFYASVDKKSAWKDALPADNTALQNGSVVESTGHVAFPPGGSMAQTQAELQVRWNAFQNEINAANPWRYYGSTWDGTTWVVTNVA
jgi:hypothetical protein